MRAEGCLLALLLAAGASAQEPGDYFARVDLDGDGRISLDEFLHRMSFAFEQMDANRDQVLAPEEQLVPNAKPITRAEHEARFTAQFQRQDSNRDGYLSRAELLAPPR